MGTIHGTSPPAFETLLRIARSSVATPPWFAPPVDADEDAEAFTIVFHALEQRQRRLQIHASDQELRVWERRPGGRQSALRVCSLPCPIVASAIETARAGDLLKVRLPKKVPATHVPAP